MWCQAYERYTSESVKSGVLPYTDTDYSGFPLKSDKASGVSGGDQKFSPYARS